MLHRRNASRIAAALYGLAAVFVWLGFAVGESRNPWIFGYSRSYALFLAVLVLLLCVPPLFRVLVRRVGWRRILSESAPAVGLIAIVCLAGARYYYATQEHRFDPFLQNPPRNIETVGEPKLPGEIRIVALGGSTTEGMESPAVDGYPARVEAGLRQGDHGLNVVVSNGGRAWWTTRHSLIYYVTHARRWRPDFVIVMHALNDLYRSFAPEAYALGEYSDDWSHFYGPAINGARPPSLPRALVGRSVRRMQQSWYSSWRRRAVDYPVERYVSLEPFERNLRTLVDLVAADGARPVLLTQASLYHSDLSAQERAVIRFGEEFMLTRTGWLTSEYPSPASLRRAMDAYNGVVRRVARETGAVLIDVDATMPRTLEFLADDVHYTSTGVDFLGAHVVAALRPMLVEARR